MGNKEERKDIDFETEAEYYEAEKVNLPLESKEEKREFKKLPRPYTKTIEEKTSIHPFVAIFLLVNILAVAIFVWAIFDGRFETDCPALTCPDLSCPACPDLNCPSVECPSLSCPEVNSSLVCNCPDIPDLSCP